MNLYNFILTFIIYTILLKPVCLADNQISHGNQSFIKCETPIILEHYLTGAGKITAARLINGEPADTLLPAQTVSTEGHFRAHYAESGFHAPDTADLNSNGIPDFVDSTLIYLEYAYDLIINELGYDPPLYDNGAGGGNEIDVYLKNYGHGGYGATYPENTVDGSSSAYIVIDNDFSEDQYATKGYDALRVTTAHEFFHTVQFRYYTNYSLIWWMENSSVWMEERVWDDVNDYLAYLNYFFNSKTTSLNTNVGNYMYGSAIWAMYLAKRYGDDIIKQIWKYISETKTVDIASFDNVIPDGLPAAFNEFAVWNYFTNYRANTDDFYPDSDMFPYTMEMDITKHAFPVVDSLGTNHLTSRYVEFLFLTDWSDNNALKIELLPRENSTLANSILFFNNPYDYRIHTVKPEGETIPLVKPWGRAVMITSCTNTSGEGFRYVFNADYTISTRMENEPLYAFVLHGTYPNPFNPSTTITFTLSEPCHVLVRVFNIHGQHVAELFDGELGAGEKRMLWKPSGIAGGIYFLTVTTPSGSLTKKMLYMK
ncbi:MXAN_6640 family putative metalloprotease [Candidatus Latescibacterota bacterium]